MLTAPHSEQSTPDVLRWRCESLATEVEYLPQLLETLRAEAADGFHSLTHGGIENGGILYGERTEGSIHIVTARRLECEHRFGPTFTLSDRDEAGLSAALNAAHDDPGLHGFEPVGLYMSHSRRSFEPADQDVRTFARYFSQPWHLLLVLMPSESGVTRAGFFIRERAAQGSIVCAREVSIAVPERRSRSGARPALVRRPPERANASRTMSVVPRRRFEAPPTEIPTPVDKDIPPFLTKLERNARPSKPDLASRPRISIVVTLAALLAGGSAAAGFLVAKYLAAEAAIPMRVTDSGAKLRIDWDPGLKQVETATGGELSIRDGNYPPVRLSVDSAVLHSGSVIYTPQSDRVEVRVKLMHASAPDSESVVFFIRPSNAEPQRKSDAAATVPAPASRLAANTRSRAVRPMRSEQIPAAAPSGNTADVQASPQAPRVAVPLLFPNPPF